LKLTANATRDKGGATYGIRIFRLQSRKAHGGRIIDIGPRKYDEFYPPFIAKNKGNWDYHEILEPGVLVHVAKNGDKVYTICAGAARLMSVTHIREICEIADKYCGGYVRFTTRNNVEFMTDSLETAKALKADIESRKFKGGSNKFPSAARAQASAISCIPRVGCTATPLQPTLPARLKR
jgi:dissimilatory sulfite reductase (desulfoviridin) alpha/beta subunit